jgi:acetaldehyde dehydrogenase/alcohol dehydrogenase
VAEGAFDDQCTGSNPRYPLISELRQLLMDSYYGRAYREAETDAVAIDGMETSQQR